MKKRYLVILLAVWATSAFAGNLNYPTTEKDGKQYYIYKVQKSEGYYAISKKFNVTIKEIMDANPTEENSLKLGQELYIPIADAQAKGGKDTKSKKTQAKETPAKDSQVKETVTTTHVIEKGDTFYNLSKRYGITVAELQKANPGVEILSIGQTLNVPGQTAVQTTTQTATQEVSETKQEIKQEAKTTSKEAKKNTKEEIKKAAEAVKEAAITVKDEVKEKVAAAFDSVAAAFEPDTLYERNAETSVRIAVLMPFANNGSGSSSDARFTDFYRGCLIAADSLSALGINVTIDAYDIGKTKESIYKTLQNKELSKANIIVGPAYTAQIPYVASYAKLHGIKLVVPFANNVKSVENNSQVFQIVCQQPSLYNNVANKCIEEWQGKKVIIVKPDSAGIRYNKKEFTDILIPKLADANIPYQYVSDERIAPAINAITAADSAEFVLVIPTTNEVKLTQISDHYDAMKTNRVSVFGFPEWNDMLHKDLYSKPLYMFTNYYLDFKNPRTVEFYNKYYTKFGAPTTQNNPSYSIFGFDITLFFGQAYCHSGKHFEQYLDSEKSDMLQMNFKFEKIPGGGYANHGVYLQLYNKQGIN